LGSEKLIRRVPTFMTENRIPTLEDKHSCGTWYCEKCECLTGYKRAKRGRWGDGEGRWWCVDLQIKQQTSGKREKKREKKKRNRSLPKELTKKRVTVSCLKTEDERTHILHREKEGRERGDSGTNCQGKGTGRAQQFIQLNPSADLSDIRRGRRQAKSLSEKKKKKKTPLWVRSANEKYRKLSGGNQSADRCFRNRRRRIEEVMR